MLIGRVSGASIVGCVSFDWIEAVEKEGSVLWITGLG